MQSAGVARTAQGPRPIARSVGAVVAGFATTFALSMGIDVVLHATGVYPAWGVRMADALFVLALAYRGLATVAGGWVTARLAPARPMGHALILAAVGTLVGLGGVAFSVNHPELGPMWYPVLLVVTAIPCVFAGAWCQSRRRTWRRP